MSEALLAQSAQKLSILEEASPSTATTVIDIGDPATQGFGLRQTAAALGFGALRGQTTQLFLLETPKGSKHFYGQPFDGRLPLPGEHHIVLPYSVPAPAVFQDGFAGGNWKSQDPVFQKQMRKHATCHLMLDIDFEWRLGLGHVKREWLAQLRPTNDGQTHFIMKATGESDVALDTRPVGFAAFTRLVLALVGTPPTQAPGPGCGFLAHAEFMDVFGKLQTEGEPLPTPRANLADRQLGNAIHQLLTPHAGGKLHVHPVAPKKEAKARTSVMPRQAQALPIIALVDLTLMGGASDAIVITESHLFYRDGDQRLVFEWSEVRAVMPPIDSHTDYVRFFLAERGWIALRCGNHVAALTALMHELAQIPA